MVAVSLFLSLLLALAVPILSQDCTSGFQGQAEAGFDGDFGVYGSAKIETNGSIVLTIDIDGLDTSICDGEPYPLQYHIHEFWSYGAEDTRDKYGTECGPDYTGGHYNPYDRPPCHEVSNPTYYNCEVGDLSGRFGLITPNILGHIRINERVNDGPCQCGRMAPEVGFTRSIVFHCNDGTRLFCSGFRMEMVAIK